MSVSRRKMISLIGGGVVLAAAAGAGGFIGTRRPNRALSPWENAGQYDEPRKRALSYAILAPNPHNRQPWVAQLHGADGLTLHRDKALNLPHTDPFDRQLTIGMGCFLELLRMAAADDGYALDTTLFPQGVDGPVAEVTFIKGGTPDALFAHVFDRHTNREAYEDRALPAAAQVDLGQIARLITAPDEVDVVRDLTTQAMVTEMTTRATYMESVELMRMGKTQIEATPDGLYLGGAFLEGLMAVGLLTRDGLADMDGSQFQMGLDMQKASLRATPAYGVITTAGNSRVNQIGAGRDWLRLHLAATGLGLAMQPVSQALQEYPEMAAHYARVHELLGGPGETVQMLGRLGYGPKIDPSARWPVEARITHA